MSARQLPARPYPGLRPFDAEEWPIFFGRERMIDDVIGRLAEARLALIHGASGSGKSSLVRAGVLPKLERQHRRHGAPWRTLTMRPAAGPLWNLAAALAQLEGRGQEVERVGALAARFNARGATIASAAGGLEGMAGQPLCLLIDQFEELFRFEKETSREEAQLFAQLIRRAADEPSEGGADVRVIITMRSEFLGECARFAGFAETINRTQYLVPRLDDEALLRAVRRPAELFGGRLDVGLADRLIASVRGREDELPLLQHALMLMWERALRGPKPYTLDAAVLDEAGGAAALVSVHANSVMQTVAPDPASALLVERVFRELTEVNAEGAAIRRPRSLSELAAAIGVEVEALAPILDAFRARDVAFVSPYQPLPLAPTSWIDIGHEAVIRCWARISRDPDGWLRAELDDGLAWRSLLVEARAFARDSNRTLSAAATGDRGALAAGRNEVWSQRYGGGWEEVAALLTASRAAANAARKARRTRTAVLTAVTVGALALTGVAVGEWREAQKQTRRWRDEALTTQQARDTLTKIWKNFDRWNDIKKGGGSPEQSLFASVKFEADKGNSFALYTLGDLYVDSLGVAVDYAKAMAAWRQAADRGLPHAYTGIGWLYERGYGVKPDFVKAREYFELGAAVGEESSMHDLGVLYENGEGVKKDYAQALQWYQRGAAAGSELSMTNLGFFYKKGYGVAEDYHKAREWYERAAAAGEPIAMRDLGVMFADGSGVAQDYAKAREWYERGAAGGDAPSMFNLGLLYENGLGVDRDFGKARALYEKSADFGDGSALGELGYLYQNGYGVTKDNAKARDWFRKGVSAGNGYSARKLGEDYRYGYGVAADVIAARGWYEKGAALGDISSASTLADMYSDGESGAKDLAKARIWYEKVATDGDGFEAEKAAKTIAAMYGAGEGGLKDYAKALIWSRKVAQFVEADEAKDLGKPGKQTAAALNSVVWYSLFTRDFAGALAAAERAHQIAPDDLVVQGNRAHALMFLNRTDEARALYLSHRDELLSSNDQDTWRQAVLGDFAAFRKEGLPTPPLMAEIETAFANSQPAPK